MHDSLHPATEVVPWLEAHSWEPETPADLLRRSSELLDYADSEGFPPILLSFLRSLVQFERGILMVFRRSKPPWSFFDEDGEQPARREENLRYGRDRLYLQDHCYRAFLQGDAEGFYCFPEFDRRNLESWGRIGCTRYGAELGFVAPVDDGSAIVLKLLRGSDAAPVKASELSTLYEIETVVTAALRVSWKTQLSDRLPSALRDNSLYEQVQLALDEFGVQTLTNRERQVVRLCLSGFSTRDAADKLGIAPATAVVHRKRAYTKLRICSQSELFAAFIRSLSRTPS